MYNLSVDFFIKFKKKILDLEHFYNRGKGILKESRSKDLKDNGRA